MLRVTEHTIDLPAKMMFVCIQEIMECIPVPERVREAVSILFSKRQRSVGIQYVAALKASEQKRQ